MVPCRATAVSFQVLASDDTCLKIRSYMHQEVHNSAKAFWPDVADSYLG